MTIYSLDIYTGAAAGRSNPTSKERWLSGCRRAERSYSTFKVRRVSCEEIPLVQGKEQQLHFAEAAVKRYPTSKKRNPSKMVGVARKHQRDPDISCEPPDEASLMRKFEK